MRRLLIIPPAVFCAILLSGAYINSTVQFRMGLAGYYEQKSQWAKAAKVYEKILRKDTVKNNLGDGQRTKINFELGRLYGNLDLKNLVIESYADGYAGFSDIDTNQYYDRTNLQKDRLLAVGLLEAGKPERAKSEFLELKRIYPDFSDAQNYINIAESLQKQGIAPRGEYFYLLLGDLYIRNQLFDEARAFFTKRIIDYGVAPIQVLIYLKKKYLRDADTKEKVWGDNIYVTLEDFEAVEPVLSRLLGGGKIKGHHIARGIAHKGNYSEFFDLTYGGQKADLWSKDTRVSLDNADLSLGIRLFIKSDNIDAKGLHFWVLYSKQGMTGICPTRIFKQDLGNGWKRMEVKDLCGAAKATALARNWSADGSVMEKVIIDTSGIPDKFYVDEIELYLMG